MSGLGGRWRANQRCLQATTPHLIPASPKHLYLHADDILYPRIHLSWNTSHQPCLTCLSSPPLHFSLTSVRLTFTPFHLYLTLPCLTITLNRHVLSLTSILHQQGFLRFSVTLTRLWIFYQTSFKYELSVSFTKYTQNHESPQIERFSFRKKINTKWIYIIQSE